MANDFVATRDQIIGAALRKVSSNSPGETIDGGEIADASFQLNALIKSWQTDIDLFKRERFILPVNVGQRVYFLGSAADGAKAFTTPDVGGPLIQETTLTTAYAASDTHIEPGTTLGVAAGDYVGFQLDSGAWHWTTVSALDSPAPGDVLLTAAIAAAAAAAQKVFFFRNVDNRPQKILEAVRVDTDNTTTPITVISRDEYVELSSPAITGAPTQVHYQPALHTGELYVWPTGSTSYPYIEMVVHTLLGDMDTADAEPDFPVEWHNALVWGLALHMIDEYDQVSPAKAARIERIAFREYERVLDYDTGTAPVRFVASRRQ